MKRCDRRSLENCLVDCAARARAPVHWGACGGGGRAASRVSRGGFGARVTVGSARRVGNRRAPNAGRCIPGVRYSGGNWERARAVVGLPIFNDQTEHVRALNLISVRVEETSPSDVPGSISTIPRSICFDVNLFAGFTRKMRR
ncbi:hypothetical protein AG1IA_09618 [Rhizoctonia solani AG-1 IA]|uniref:Uncharacterized protein n=1 Tax=Thanatephorus cucumeris (strain AG1-IA) TaxID=983506 RepID=L8WHU0_THACA|nr:hypothetical protein AG1IA_09618 [Rhizoctonia solani AG-1 IA]